MIDKNFDVISANLYRTYCESYNLNDFIYSEYKHKDLEEYFEYLKPLFYLNLKNSEDYLNYLKIINTCLFVYFELFPDLRKNINTFNHSTYKVKTLKCKQSWYELVNKTKRKPSKNKYIEKELETINSLQHDSHRQKRLQEIMNWVIDENQLLSDFIYLGDLVYKQKKIILQIDPLVLLLNEINDYQNHPITTCLMNFESDDSRFMMIPDTLFKHPTEFTFKELRLDELDHSEVNGQYEFGLDKDSKVIVSLPALEIIKDDLTGLTIDLNVDKITSNSFDFKILSHLLQISLKNLLNGVPQTTFLIKDVCEMAGLPINTHSYNRIRSVLMLAKTKLITTVEDGRTHRYNHINRISEPTSNEDKEQLWQIEWGSHIHKEIELKKYKIIFSEQFSLKSNLAILLSRMIIKDVTPDTKFLDYSLEDIINATLIPGKPSERKKKIIEALNEIIQKENPLITEFFADDAKNNFKLIINEKVIYENFKNTHLA